MLMPGRKYSSGKYRYGFNGKESDNEVKGDGNEQDYGMRLYNTRIGKFLSVDPILKRFPYYSPYHFAGNTPIWAIDLDGKEPNFKYSENGIYGVGNFSDLMVGSINKLSTKLVVGKGDKKFQIEWLVTENGDPLGYLASRIIPEEEYKRYYGGSANGIQPAFVIESDKFFDFGKRIDEFYDKSSKSELYDVLWGQIDRDPAKRFFDPRAWLLGEVGSSAGQLSLSLFKTGVLRYASMSNTEVRAWYNLRLGSINTRVPWTEESAKMIVAERNAVKQTARLLMKDRKAANKLDETDPIRDFEYYKNKYSNEGYQGEELWKVIIEKAKSPNQIVNKKFGIQ